MRVRTALFVLLAVTFFLASSSCTKPDHKEPQARKIVVVTTLFPLYDFTKNVVGDLATVYLLLPPGTEPHSFEPSPHDMLKINDADIFIYTGPFMEPWADRVLKGIDRSRILIVDASSGVTLLAVRAKNHEAGHKGPDTDSTHSHNHRDGQYDPHIWLDFANAEKMVDTITEALSIKDPLNRVRYTENASVYKSKMAELDKRYKEKLSRCAARVFVHGGHYAFSYLANRYGLVYISAYEGSPNAEPSPRRLAYLESVVLKNRSKGIFYEELITPRIAETLSRETGIPLLKLHGAHNISRDEMSRGVTFLSLMEDNLINLSAGLNCP
jgi:zinc transport system substrate-binding protein